MMMRQLRKKMAHGWVWLGGKKTEGPIAGSGSQAKALMKSAPERLSLNYRVMTDPERIDHLFFRLRDDFYGLIEKHRRARQGASPFIREAGRLPPDRPYFYLKPLNEPGWLFERSGQGWTVSRAEKIVSKDTFVRTSQVWDQVVLHESEPGVAALPRVSSPQLGAEMVSFGIYQDLLLRSLGLGLESGSARAGESR